MEESGSSSACRVRTDLSRHFCAQIWGTDLNAVGAFRFAAVACLACRICRVDTDGWENTIIARFAVATAATLTWVVRAQAELKPAPPVARRSSQMLGAPLGAKRDDPQSTRRYAQKPGFADASQGLECLRRCVGFNGSPFEQSKGLPSGSEIDPDAAVHAVLGEVIAESAFITQEHRHRAARCVIEADVDVALRAT